MQIYVTCGKCNKDHVVVAKRDDVLQWKEGVLIQNALPYLTAAERELIITGICGDCFAAMVPEEGV